MAAASASPSGGAPSKHALHDAVERDDLVALAELLRPRVTPPSDPSFPPIELPPLGLNLRDPLGATPLHAALLAARPRALSLLLGAGARANLPLEGIPSLCLACAAGSLPGRGEDALACIDLLLAHDSTLTKCPPHERDDANRSALHWAAEAGLARAPARLAARALEAAAKQARRVAQAGDAGGASTAGLLGGGAAGSAGAPAAPVPAIPPLSSLQDKWGDLALHVAARVGDAGALRALFAAARAEGRLRGDGLAPELGEESGPDADADAARTWAELVGEEAGHGAEKSEAPGRGDEPLSGPSAGPNGSALPLSEPFAVSNGSAAPPSASAPLSPAGRSPLSSLGHLRALLSTRNRQGLTPLGEAASVGALEAVRLLARAAPQEVSRPDRRGKTPAQLAAERGHAEVAEWLQSQALAAKDGGAGRVPGGGEPKAAPKASAKKGGRAAARGKAKGDAGAMEVDDEGSRRGGVEEGQGRDAAAAPASVSAPVPPPSSGRRGVLVLAPPECWTHLTTTEADLARGRDAWEELPPENVARLAAILGHPGGSTVPEAEEAQGGSGEREAEEGQGGSGEGEAEGATRGRGGEAEGATRGREGAYEEEGNAAGGAQTSTTSGAPASTSPSSCPPGIPPSLFASLRSLSPFGGLLRDPRLAALGVRVDARPGRRAPMADVLRVHDWAYVKSVKDLSERAQATLRQAREGGPGAGGPTPGLARYDGDTVVSAGTWRAALAAAGAAIDAVDVVLGVEREGEESAKGAATTVCGHEARDPTTVRGHEARDPTEVRGPKARDPTEVRGPKARDPTEVRGPKARDPTEVRGPKARDPTEVRGSAPRAHRYRAVFCATRPPGHHAGPTGMVPADVDQVSSNGFCILNNAAIAAAYALCVHRSRVERVAILDFDVHHGNGTQACVVGAVPAVVSTPLVTPWATGSLDHPVWRPWRDEGDRNRIFFASIQGFGPKEVGEGGVVSPTEPYIYPGSGATGDNWEEENVDSDTHKGSGTGAKGTQEGGGTGAKGTHKGGGTGAKGTQEGGGTGAKGTQEGGGTGAKGTQEGGGTGAKGTQEGGGTGAKGTQEGGGTGAKGNGAGGKDASGKSSTANDSTANDSTAEATCTASSPPAGAASSSSLSDRSLLPPSLFPSFSGPPPAPREAPRVIDVGIGGPGPRPGAFRRAWRDKVLTALDAFAPSLIFVCAGFDAHRKDVLNHRFVGLSEPDYRWATDLVMQVAERHCPGRVISILEGGYRIQGGPASAFARSVAAHVRAMAEPSTKTWNQQEQDAERTREEKHAEEREKAKREKREKAEREQREHAAANAAAAAAANDAATAAAAASAQGGAPAASNGPSGAPVASTATTAAPVAGGGTAPTAPSASSPLPPAPPAAEAPGGRRRRRSTPVDYAALNAKMEEEARAAKKSKETN